MDKFEKHIRDNSKAFDELKANRKKLWENIEGRIPTQEAKRIPLWKRASTRAAAVIFLVAFIGLGISKINTSNDTFADLGSEQLIEIDGHYDVLMKAKIQLIQNNPKLEARDKEEFMAFLKDLDAEYEELKIELEKDLDNEKVLEAIIQNYRKRLQLMEHFLDKLNETKNYEDGESIII